MRPHPWRSLGICAALVALFALPMTQQSGTYAFLSDAASDTGNSFSADFWADVCEDAGPDVFGYTCQQVGYRFENISLTGTPLSLIDDQVSGAISLGFSFDFYGLARTTVRVSSNGFLPFPVSGHGCCSGQNLPNMAAPNNLTAGYWEDLNPAAGGTIHYQRLGASPERRFIAQFTRVPHFPNTNQVTFQVVLNETGHIFLNYENAPTDGGTHGSGIENMTGKDGLTYKFGSFSVVQKSIMFVHPAGPFIEPEEPVGTPPIVPAGMPDPPPNEPAEMLPEKRGTLPCDECAPGEDSP